jgi:hypothetical protein
MIIFKKMGTSVHVMRDGAAARRKAKGKNNH